MKSRTYRVVPRIPETLGDLKKIAENTWWCWNRKAIELFRSMDQDLWEVTHHNPTLLLGRISQIRLEELAGDPVFLSEMNEVSGRMNEYLHRPTWFEKHHSQTLNKGEVIAYFSAEFGLHESLPIYSGGLGVLAGDTLKSTSDLGLPVVGVSILYRLGYFNQYLNSDGWQQESYSVNDYSNMPVERVKDSNGNAVTIVVPMGAERVLAAIWRIKVGRVKLFLLDTNLPENTPENRDITGQLYGGDKEMRIRQEILLGAGGIMALRAMGLTPVVRHINEGHSGFLIVEMMAHYIETGLSFPEAREMVTAGNVFTTHTPVPAGNEEFHNDLVLRYLRPYLDRVGLNNQTFLKYGSQSSSPNFSMTVFALNFSRKANGVSRLHGEVSRNIWRNVWPRLPETEIPVGYVTNGVHESTWISGEIRRLLQKYVGSTSPKNPEDENFWHKISRIPDSELWRAHERLRARLVGYARRRWANQLETMGIRGLPQQNMPVLNPDALTIGFARRFATYKRASLLLSDLDRLTELLNNSSRPIQVVFAGKAHPHDNGGKDLIREIFHASLSKELYGKLVYLSDYNMDMARHMVHGVDVWLNTPRIPMEASGTSGMKAAMNGIPHCSVLDGWWAEGYRPDRGWAIGNGETYEDSAVQDRIEAKALYDLLENMIAPLFHDRGNGGIPTGWTAMMKQSMHMALSEFNTNRMVAEYTGNYYMPALSFARSLGVNNMEGAKELANWKEAVREKWQGITIAGVEPLEMSDTLTVGDSIEVSAKLRAPGLSAEDLSVEAQFGEASGDDWLSGRTSTVLKFSREEDGMLLFNGSIPCMEAGRFGFTVRVLPAHPKYGRVVEPGLVHWWE
ncbi:MAG: alpha-glucan family phosphorylase [Candidatus Fermentibacteraceae bacterium]|nr:alpha-glucan family phosphorylase [Candidatus Fermentibacteraceae bacterium]